MNNTVWKTGGQGYGTQVLLHAIFVEGARLLLTFTVGGVSSVVDTAGERRSGYIRQPVRCTLISIEPAIRSQRLIFHDVRTCKAYYFLEPSCILEGAILNGEKFNFFGPYLEGP